MSAYNQTPMGSLTADDLTRVVRLITGDAAASVLPGWTAKRIGKSVGFGTVGIYRVSGQATLSAGTRHWSVVAKVLDERAGGSGVGFNSPKTEIAAYRSGILGRPDGAVSFRAATCHAIDDKPDGSHWLWLEDISDAPVPPWTDDLYISAARHTGQFSGSWLGRPLPSETWLGRESFKTVIFQKSSARAEEVLALRQNTIMARVLPADLIERASVVSQDHRLLVSALQRMPFTVCHTDCHAKNLLLVVKGSEHEATVAIDWASASLGPVGIDSGGSIGSGLLWTEMGVEQARRIEKPVFESYLAGLGDAGWRGDPRHVRLGYLTSMTTYGGAMVSSAARFTTDVKFQERISGLVGKPIEDILTASQHSLRFLLPLLDEAVELAKTV